MDMKNKPLGRDAVSYIDGIHLTGEVVSVKRVKSAVKGLQHDIIYEKEFVMFPRTGKKALELVRRWFPDAIDNDTKKRVE